MDPALVTSWQAWAFLAAAAGSVSVALLTWCVIRPTHPLRRLRRLALVAAIVGLGITGVNAAMLLAEEMWDCMSQSPGLGDLAMWSLAGALAAAAALLGRWALLADRSRGRRRCPKCWYDMSATNGLVCPECGKDAKRERRLFRTRRRKRWVAAALVVLLGAGVTAGLPVMRGRHWSELVPTYALIVALPYMQPDSGAAFELESRAESVDPDAGAPPLTPRMRRMLLPRCRQILEEGETNASRCELALALVATLEQEATELEGLVHPLLRARDPRVRSSAVAAVASIAQDPSDGRHAVAPLLQDSNLGVRKQALFALAVFVRGDTASEPPPAELVQTARTSTDQGFRSVALKGLSRYRAVPDSIAAAAAAIESGESSSGLVARGIHALILLDPLNPLALPALVRELRSSDTQAQEHASQVLVNLVIGLWGELEEGQLAAARAVFDSDEVAAAAAFAFAPSEISTSGSAFSFCFESSDVPLRWKQQALATWLGDDHVRQALMDRIRAADRRTLRVLADVAQTLPPNTPGRDELLTALGERSKPSPAPDDTQD